VGSWRSPSFAPLTSLPRIAFGEPSWRSAGEETSALIDFALAKSFAEGERGGASLPTKDRHSGAERAKAGGTPELISELPRATLVNRAR
jgi:hypothetical protein